MAQYNITQTELHEKADDDEKFKLAGQSIVQVTARDDQKGKVVNFGFTTDLVWAMKEYFDCKSCSKSKK